MCVYYLDPGTLVQWLLLVPSFMACVISAVGLMIVFGFTAFTEVHCYLTLLRKRSGVHPGSFFLLQLHYVLPLCQVTGSWLRKKKVLTGSLGVSFLEG